MENCACGKRTYFNYDHAKADGLAMKRKGKIKQKYTPHIYRCALGNLHLGSGIKKDKRSYDLRES